MKPKAVQYWIDYLIKNPILYSLFSLYEIHSPEHVSYNYVRRPKIRKNVRIKGVLNHE